MTKQITQNWTFSGGYNAAIRVDFREESNLPEIVNEWIRRNSPKREIIREINSDGGLAEDMVLKFGDQDDVLDFYESKNAAGKKVVIYTVVAPEGVKAQGRKSKDVFPAQYESWLIYCLVIHGKAGHIDQYNRDVLELNRLGYSNHATDSVPLVKVENEIELNSIMTAAEAAETFGLAEATVRQSINRGQIPARKSAGTWLIRRADAEKKWKA